MLVPDRHRLLLQRLEESGSLRVQGLDRELGVNVMTIWRDLRLLERRGLLRRVHGGAVRTDRSVEPAFRLKQQHALAKKRLIAATAAEHYAKAGDIVMLEGGTTVAELLTHLPARDLTLLTNSLPILSRAHALGRGWQIRTSGGSLSPVSGNFVGPEAVGFFKKNFANTFFMSATGLDLDHGLLTDPNPVEIEVKRAMAVASQRVVLLLDSSKIGIRSASEVLPLAEIDVLVCDDGLDRAALRRLKELGVTVQRCR